MNEKYPPSKSRFGTVYLIHGRGGSPNGSVLSLEAILQHGFYETRFERPLWPHANAELPTESCLLNLLPRRGDLKPGSLVVGLDIGGLLAAKLQEYTPHLDLHVITLMSPTNDQGIKLEEGHPNRVALFSSADKQIEGRTDWDKFTYPGADIDLPILTQHDALLCTYSISYLISAYMQDKDMNAEVRDMFRSDEELLKPGIVQL